METVPRAHRLLGKLCRTRVGREELRLSAARVTRRQLGRGPQGRQWGCRSGAVRLVYVLVSQWKPFTCLTKQRLNKHTLGTFLRPPKAVLFFFALHPKPRIRTVAHGADACLFLLACCTWSRFAVVPHAPCQNSSFIALPLVACCLLSTLLHLELLPFDHLSHPRIDTAHGTIAH